MDEENMEAEEEVRRQLPQLQPFQQPAQQLLPPLEYAFLLDYDINVRFPDPAQARRAKRQRTIELHMALERYIYSSLVVVRK